MSTRPENPLFSALTVLDGVDQIAKNFENLGITRPRDLLFTLPYSGIKRDLVATVQGPTPHVLTVQVLLGRTKRGAQNPQPTVFRPKIRKPRSNWYFSMPVAIILKMLPVGATRLCQVRSNYSTGRPNGAS